MSNDLVKLLAAETIPGAPEADRPTLVTSLAI